MDVLKYPIIILSICFGLGIFVQFYLSLPLQSLIISVSFFVALFVGFFIKKQKKHSKSITFGLITFLLFSFIGSISYYLHQDINHKNHYSNLEFNSLNKIEGVVVSELKPNEFYTKFIVDVHKFNNQNASGKILIYFSKKNSKYLFLGDEISTISEINPILKNYNPNTFNYANYMENQNVFHQVKCFENDYFIGKKVKNFNYYINEFRKKLVSSFDKHHFSKKTKSIINALLLGQKQELDNETMNDYKNAGVVHILAISGLHIGIIFSFFNLIFGFLDKFKNGKTFKVIIIILLLWLFALISGMSASITRAVLLFSLIAIGNFLNRKNSVFNSLAASFLILLIYNPLNLFDVGFQLSYAAVISILLFQPFYEKCYFSKNKIVVYITDLFLVSIAAQIGVLPLMMLYFKQIPTLFLLANLVVIPIATIILILGVVTLFLNFIALPIALFIGKIISFCVEIMNHYIHWISSFDNYVIKNISFTPSLAVLLYALVLSFIYWTYKPKNKRFLNVLFFALAFQILYFNIKSSTSVEKEFIVFNNKESIISIFESNKITFYTNDSLIDKNQSIQEYTTAKFNPKVDFHSLENVLFFKNMKILIVDENTIYNTSIKPDVVVIRQNSRINIERLILNTKPRIIISDKSNSFTSIKRWKAICLKYKIPFHAIAEKGFYKM